MAAYSVFAAAGNKINESGESDAKPKHWNMS